jgi:hypothetical protein
VWVPSPQVQHTCLYLQLGPAAHKPRLWRLQASGMRCGERGESEAAAALGVLLAGGPEVYSSKGRLPPWEPRATSRWLSSGSLKRCHPQGCKKSGQSGFERGLNRTD